jgi:hypothetical protein
MPEKIKINNITLDKKDYDEFMKNAAKLDGPPRGTRTRGIVAAIKIFNNYFKEFDGETQLIEIAKENNLPPWQMGAILIKIALPVYTEYKKYCDENGLDVMDEHLKMAHEFFESLHKD